MFVILFSREIMFSNDIFLKEKITKTYHEGLIKIRERVIGKIVCFDVMAAKKRETREFW